MGSLRLSRSGLALVLAGIAAAALLLALALANGSQPEPAVAKSKGFTPKSLKGKWIGTWTNETFLTSGTVRADVSAPSKGKKLRIVLDYGGTVFGCTDPGPITTTLSKGSGANKWNSKGFKTKGTSPAFGTMELAYKHSDKSLDGKGSGIPCAPGVSFTVDSTLTNKSFTGKIAITGPAFTANTTQSVSKQ